MATNQNVDAFANKYKKQIEGISRANNVDWSVARDMLISNAQGTGNYKGGGVANMNDIRNDYNNAIAADSKLNKGYSGGGGYGNATYSGGASSGSTTNSRWYDDGYNASASGSSKATITTQPANAQPSARDSYYADMLEQMKAKEQAAAEAQAEAQRQAIAANKAAINNSYANSARQAYILSQQQQQALPELLAAQGQTGGATETALLGLQTNYQNNLADLDASKNAALANANLADADISAALAGQLADINTNYGNKLLNYYQDAENQARSDYLNTIGQYSNDYQAEINSLLASGVPENDYRIQYLRSARQQKINDLAKEEAAAQQQAAKAAVPSVSRGATSGQRSYTSRITSNDNTVTPATTTTEPARAAVPSLNLISTPEQDAYESALMRNIGGQIGKTLTGTQAVQQVQNALNKRLITEQQAQRLLAVFNI